MSGFAVALSGLDDLDAALAAVVDVLTDPATEAAGAQLVAAGARPFIPRDTGKLAASEQVAGGQLVYAVPYSAIVSASQPWLGAGISASLDALVDLYARKALEAWGP